MTTGVKPNLGYELIEGRWVLGVANMVNASYEYGFSAAGSNHAGATQLPANIGLIEVDTVGSGAGVALPPAIAGTVIMLNNNQATNALLVYPSIANNPLTGAQDKINNATDLSVAADTGVVFFCAKNGVWAAT